MTRPWALAADYQQARSRFRDAAAAAGLTVEPHGRDARGPDGGDLSTDLCWIGPPDAADVIVIASGTHGVEGFAGSLCQSAWLEGGGAQRVPDGVAVVLVHALNPYGFAWIRRVDEDNVDVNRNFVDLDSPPANHGYDQLASALVGPRRDEKSEAATAEALMAYIAEHGMDEMAAAVTGGQFRHPDGLFYGGIAPSPSHRFLRDDLIPRLAGARRVAVLDLHTGLGEWSEVEIITPAPPGTPGYDRAVSWWGDRVASNHGGKSVSAPLAGEWFLAVQAWLPDAEVTLGAMEWGTVDSVTVLQALRADAWLHAHSDPTGPDAAPIKAELRAAFAPADPAWADAVVRRCHATIDDTFAALTAADG